MGRQATYEAGQLRRTLTIWPPGPVPMPLTIGSGFLVQLLDGDPQILQPILVPAKTTPVPLPDEWVLRELPRLDLDDPKVFITLWETYGPLLTSGAPFALLPGDEDSQPFGLLHAAQRDLDHQSVSDHTRGVSLTVVRHHFELLQALMSHVVALRRARPLAKAWGSVHLNQPVQNARDAWFTFEQVMNAALSPFSVNVRVYRNREYGLRTAAPLYAIAALQILNVLEEGLPVLSCANERCTRFFQRQLGRAAEGQYRTSGVMFCSHQCADAQRQRERRRQKRKDRR
jgi:hypothetical protein